MDDLYNRKRRLERVLEKLEQTQIPVESKEKIRQFAELLKAEGLSDGRVQKYVEQLTKIALLTPKSLEGCDKQDVIAIMSQINSKGYQQWTIHDYKVTLKQFFKWLRGYERNSDEYPPEVKWLKGGSSSLKSKLPEELVDEEEVQELTAATTNERDAAFIPGLYDVGGRIGEWLGLRIKHIVFDRYGAVAMLSGKTGMRRVRLIASSPAIMRWLDRHPFKEDPEAPLWIGLGTRNHYKRMSYQSARKVLNEAAKRAGIRKKIHPHLFRHSRATHLANFLTERQMETHFGWKPGSKMPSIYVHLSGKDVDKTLLKAHGIEVEENEELKFKPKVCKRCGEKNSPGFRFCTKCGTPIDTKTFIEYQEALDKRAKVIERILEDEEIRALIKKKILSFVEVEA